MPGPWWCKDCRRSFYGEDNPPACTKCGAPWPFYDPTKVSIKSESAVLTKVVEAMEAVNEHPVGFWVARVLIWTVIILGGLFIARAIVDDLRHPSHYEVCSHDATGLDCEK